MKTRNKILTAFLAMGLVAGALGISQSASAENIFRIEIGKKEKRHPRASNDRDAIRDLREDNRDLQERIWRLERAVLQLQNEVFHLQKEAHRPRNEKKFTCYINSFGKTFTHTSTSEMEARAKTIEKCTSENHAMHCPDSKVKCGS